MYRIIETEDGYFYGQRWQLFTWATADESLHIWWPFNAQKWRYGKFETEEEAVKNLLRVAGGKIPKFKVVKTWRTKKELLNAQKN